MNRISIFGRPLLLHVVWALILGVVCGLILGPYCTLLQPVGDAYVMLLQMVALPYICFSLIHGLGSMTKEGGKKLFFHGWPFWFLLWGSVLGAIYLCSYLIPSPIMAIVPMHALDPDVKAHLLDYLIPQNPIYDLAHNIVPAVVLFGVIVGCALLHLPKKEPLLSILEQSNAIMEKIFVWLAILAPIGIFAHIAVVFGTVYFEELYKLQLYVWSFLAISLFLTFWVLPNILCSLTPLSYGQAVRAIRFVCLLPFATALPMISFPFIAIYLKKLGEEHAQDDPRFHATAQTAMPICYGFGQIGNCLILFFVFFLSFYFRRPFLGAEKGIISLLVLPLSLGSSTATFTAVDFLIRLLDFPEAAKDLFAQTMEVTMNFQVLVSTASVLTFLILVLYAYYGLLRISWGKLLSRVGLGFVTLAVLVGSIHPWVHLKDNYEDLYANLSMQEAISHPVASKVLSQSLPLPSSLPKERKDTFETILGRRVLRVGYDADNIPYSYWNGKGELVGLDIAFAYQLARDLDCSLEFWPIDLGNMGKELLSGNYDIGMSAILMNENRLREMDFTHPYSQQDNVLVVPTKKRKEFLRLATVQERTNLTIGAVGGYVPIVERHFPHAKILLGDSEPTLKGGADAYIWSHIPGFVWCLSHPGYVAIDYEGLIGTQYFAYAIPNGSLEWGSFLNNWLLLKEQSGFQTNMEKYWINGESPKEKPPRWSLLRYWNLSE